jgi:hypothetical protein
MATELDTRMALLESRIRFRKEIWKALSCTSKKQKLKLVEEWRAKYDEHHVKTLLNCVRNTQAARDILDWKLDEL